MKKYLLFIMALCAGCSAFAQMATTYKKGTHGEQRLVSADERNICFRTTAQRLEADLNPSTHSGGMSVIKSSDFNGFTEVTSVEYSNETVLNTLQYYNMNGTTATATWNVGQSSDTYYGSGSSDATNYVDLTGFDELRIYRDSELGFRAFFINAAGTGTNKIDINSTNVTWNGSYFAIDLSKVEKYNDKIYLNTIKSESYGINNVVNNVTVCNVTNTTASRPAKCTYTYDSERKVGTFSYSNVRTGNAAVNLMNNLKNVISNYENFVIRTLNVSTPLEGQTVKIHNYDGSVVTRDQTNRYCLQFCDENNNVLHQAYIYSEDIKIIPLHEFFSDEDFAKINSVWLSTAGGDTDLSATIQVAEAYLISAYDLNRGTDTNNYAKGEYFYDMDDKYIGNAYIHPSYFMMSNGVLFDDQTGQVSMDMNVYSYVDLNKTMYNDDNCAFLVGTDVTVPSGQNEVIVYGGLFWNDITKYADLSEYDKMYVKYDATKTAPALVFNMTQFTTDPQYFNEINGTNYQDYVNNGVLTIASDGWVIDLNAMRNLYSNSNLHFIKATDATLVTSILLEKVEERGPASAGKNDKTGRIQLSVPFSGFDMSEVTVVSMDNAEDGDVIGRWICGYLDYYRHYNVPESHWNYDDKHNKDIYLATENENPHDIRTLYVSRYNGEFEPPVDDKTYPAYQEYKTKVNNIYWDTKNDESYSMTIYDICITKNHVITRNGGNHTKLSQNLYHVYDQQGNMTSESTSDGGDFVEIGTDGISGDGKTVYGRGDNVKWYNYADLSNFYKMQIKGTPKAELRIMANREYAESGDGGSMRETYVRLDNNGLANVDIAAIVAEDGMYHLNAIKTPWGYSESVKLDYIKLYGEEDGIVELNSELFHSWIRDENTTVTREIGKGGTNAASYGIFTNQIGTGNTIGQGGTIYGPNYMILKENYAELTGYKTLRVYGTDGMDIRLVFNRTKNDADLEDGENAADFQQDVRKVISNGYADFDLRPYVYFHLNSIKNYYGGTGTISKVELISDERVDYVLEGNGTLSKTADEAKSLREGGTNAIPWGGCAMDAINDVGARVIDGRTRVNISRTSLAYPENPNLLFLMRKSLTKKQNERYQFDTPSTTTLHGATTDAPIYANMVAVDGILASDYKIGDDGFSSDNIHLFDGYPFSAPRDIKYSTARLTRKTTGGKIGTLILPFESSYVKGDAYETTYAEYAETASKVGKGILGDIFIDANDHVLLYKLHEGNTEAYMPYLYVADETSDNTEIFAVANGTITKTPEVGPETAPAEYMTNNYQDQKDRHYLRGFMESTHVENMYGYNSAGDLKRATKATMTPFRVMIQAPIDVNQDAAQQATAGGVKILLAKFDENDEPTEIKVVDAAELEGIVDVYSVNGALIKKSVKAADAVNSLPKGVYVIGGKKIVK